MKLFFCLYTNETNKTVRSSALRPAGGGANKMEQQNKTREENKQIKTQKQSVTSEHQSMEEIESATSGSVCV